MEGKEGGGSSSLRRLAGGASTESLKRLWWWVLPGDPPKLNRIPVVGLESGSISDDFRLRRLTGMSSSISNTNFVPVAVVVTFAEDDGGSSDEEGKPAK